MLVFITFRSGIIFFEIHSMKYCMGKRIYLKYGTQIRYFTLRCDAFKTSRGSAPPSSQSNNRTLRACTPYLVRLVEKQAEVGEDNPELLPAVAVLELP